MTTTIQTNTAPSSSTTSGHNIALEQWSAQSTPTNQSTADLEMIVHRLTCGNPSAITYRQIEEALTIAGYEPFDEDVIYLSIIDVLEQRNVLVVETLADDCVPEDDDAIARMLADETWDMLKSARLPVNEYHHPLLDAARERRLLEVYQDSTRAQHELADELSAVQRHAALQRVEAGTQALDELMRCNLRLVIEVAMRYAPHAIHLTLDDLIQEGRIGLYKAIERYDLSRDLRLSTYAMWWVRQAITRAMANGDRMIRLPVHVQENLRFINQARQQWMDTYGREPQDTELAIVLDMPIKTVQRIRQMSQSTVSFDVPIGRDHDTVLGDLIPDTHQYEPSRLVSQAALPEVIRETLAKLTDRERRVIMLRFGLADGKSRTLQEVGEEFGVTRERIRQIEVKALRRLRHPRVKSMLRDFRG